MTLTLDVPGVADFIEFGPVPVVGSAEDWRGFTPVHWPHHDGLAVSRWSAHSSRVHRTDAVWAAVPRGGPDEPQFFAARFECSALDSINVDLVPAGTEITCPACFVNEKAAAFGYSVGEPTIYYAKRDGLIKIGSSGFIGERIRNLKAEFLACEPESLCVSERSRHAQFAHLRQHGEWFEAAPELLAHVEALIGKASA